MWYLVVWLFGIVIGLCIGHEKIRTAILTWLRSHIASKDKGKKRKTAKRAKWQDD